MRVVFFLVAAAAIATCFRAPQRSIVGGAPVSPQARVVDDETIVGPRHMSSGYPARNPDATVNAVIEIPTGTTGKFEVDESDGSLRWALDRDDGSRRAIDYLAYPVNYGMVPSTLAADGDPLDAVVLGGGIERAAVVRTRIIGVLEMAHDGTRDDKLIAVPLDAPWRNGFSRVHGLAELDRDYPEVRAILVLWFSNYWGSGATEVVGWGDAAEAERILDDSVTRSGSSTRLGSPDPRLRGASRSGGRADAPLQLPRP